MATKFLRVRCLLCNKLRVSWKCICFFKVKRGKPIFFCWGCAGAVNDKLNTFALSHPVNKKYMLSRAKRAKVEKRNPYADLGER